MKDSKLISLFSQPHQPFFLLGIINAIVVMVLFILGFKGILGFDARLLHVYGVFFLIFTNLFYGFSYTTFTRFSSQAPIPTKSYLRVWLLNLLVTVSFYSSLYIPILFYASAILMAFSFALTFRIFLPIYSKAPNPKSDQYWIIVGYGMGFLSNLLFLLSKIPCKGCSLEVFFNNAIEIGFYLYLIFLPAVIGFRMVPFFSMVRDYKKSHYFHIGLFWLLFAHILLVGLYPKALFIVDLLLAILITRELFRIKLPFPNPDPLLWGLHLALFWLPLGFFAGGVVEFFEAWFGYSSFYLSIHLLALGFLMTILIAFGTRVTLGHSANPLVVDRFGKVIFYFTQVVVLGRFILSLSASYGKITPWFDISATLWITLFTLWLIKYGKFLFFRAN